MPGSELYSGLAILQQPFRKHGPGNHRHEYQHTYVPIYTSINDIRAATDKGADLKILKLYLIREWPHTEGEVEPGVERYWLIRHELVIIDGIAKQSRITPYILQKKILEQLHSNHVGIEKM